MARKKPKSYTLTLYDYGACRDYIGKKYLCGDLWGWLIEHGDIHNGCLIELTKEILDDEDTDWDETDQKEIYRHFIEEFANEQGILKMWCWW